jgi:tetratricopeptide (TPR) repeat protein
MVSEQKRQMLKYYNEGLNLYKNMKFKEALSAFEKALEYEPGDGPAQLYINRCKELIKNPPPPDWDGVFIMTTK